MENPEQQKALAHELNKAKIPSRSILPNFKRGSKSFRPSISRHLDPFHFAFRIKEIWL